MYIVRLACHEAAILFQIQYSKGFRLTRQVIPANDTGRMFYR